MIDCTSAVDQWSEWVSAQRREIMEKLEKMGKMVKGYLEEPLSRACEGEGTAPIKIPLFTQTSKFLMIIYDSTNLLFLMQNMGTLH